MNWMARIKTAMQSVFNDVSGRPGYIGFMGRILEPFAGAWQKNIAPETTQNILAFSAVYACISLIANDISKLCIDLTEYVETPLLKGKRVTHRAKAGYWLENDNPAVPFIAVLMKPNGYQTRQQFISLWITSKLIYGNAYILKERDKRGVVTDLHVLDARRVVPMVATNGDVYYQLTTDLLAGVADSVTIPADEIMHDRMTCLWHPLIGISPIYACGAAATQGIRIQANSAHFFENMSRPSGQLTSPNTIDDVTADRLKKTFEENFSGGRIGRLLVAGDGLKYEPMAIPATDAQLIEQLRWTVEDVARTFMVPEYKIATSASGRSPAANLAQLSQEYYNQTLQVHIESIEALLDEGLSLPSKYRTQVDLSGLLRMDPLSRAETLKTAIAAGYLAPNEARDQEDLPAVEGGDSPMLQQQNYSLAALAKRDASDDPFGTAKPAAPAAPQPAPAEPAPPEPKQLMLPAPAVEIDYRRLAEAVTDAQEARAAEETEELMARLVLNFQRG